MINNANDKVGNEMMVSLSSAPKAILGTMTFGDTVSEREAARIVDTARSLGVTSIDTADVYAGGESERILSRILPADDNHTLASKVGMHSVDGHAPLSATGIRASVESSLRRLGRERIDLLYFHKPDYETPLSESLTAVAQLVVEGKIADLGFSNYAAWQAVDLIHTSAQVGAPRPRIGQQLYNVISRRIEDEYVAFAEDYAVPTAAYNPLAGGLLTGRYHTGAKPHTGRFADSKLASTYRERYWSAHTFTVLGRLVGLAGEIGMPLPELSLRWLSSRSAVQSIVVGASSVEQLRENVGAIERGPLSFDLTDKIDLIGSSLKGYMPAYNR